MHYLLLCILLFFTININAQIDTTDWYPLHIGDKWEYYGQGYGYSQVEIIGDTLMSNGKTYFIFSDGVYAWRFQRKQGDRVYYYSTANQKEYLLFDFITKDKTLWIVDFDFYWGILETGSDNQNNLLNENLSYKIFERSIIDTTINPPDTTWGYLIDAYPTRITKGLAITSYKYDLTTLVGVVINGVGYGTLVSVNENIAHVNEFHLYQNYPNPFNPTTKIEYQIPKSGFVNISVYNTLGQKVSVLVNQKQNAGSYNVNFNANNLPSGIYFYKLECEDLSQINKMLLLK